MQGYIKMKVNIFLRLQWELIMKFMAHVFCRHTLSYTLVTLPQNTNDSNSPKITYTTSPNW